VLHAARTQRVPFFDFQAVHVVEGDEVQHLAPILGFTGIIFLLVKVALIRAAQHDDARFGAVAAGHERAARVAVRVLRVLAHVPHVLLGILGVPIVGGLLGIEIRPHVGKIVVLTLFVLPLAVQYDARIGAGIVTGESIRGDGQRLHQVPGAFPVLVGEVEGIGAGRHGPPGIGEVGGISREFGLEKGCEVAFDQAAGQGRPRAQ
jgi:hypothetical protein